MKYLLFAAFLVQGCVSTPKFYPAGSMAQFQHDAHECEVQARYLRYIERERGWSGGYGPLGGLVAVLGVEQLTAMDQNELRSQCMEGKGHRRVP